MKTLLRVRRGALREDHTVSLDVMTPMESWFHDRDQVMGRASPSFVGISIEYATCLWNILTHADPQRNHRERPIGPGLAAALSKPRPYELAVNHRALLLDWALHIGSALAGLC